MSNGPLDPLDPLDRHMSNGHFSCPLDPMDIDMSSGHSSCPLDPMEYVYVQWTFDLSVHSVGCIIVRHICNV
jgi:hypothetical protein